MNGLRRALGLGLKGGCRRWPVGGPRAAPGGFSTVPSVERPMRRRGAGAVIATTAKDPREEQEEFVFPEYAPEEPDAEKLLRRAFEEEEEKEAIPRVPREPGPLQAPDDFRPKPPRRRRPHKAPGTSDPSIPSSGVSCSGCGAELQCRDPALAGFLPSTKYLSLLGEPPQQQGKEQGKAQAGEHPEKTLEDAICQRCWLLIHHQQALRVQVTHEEYRSVVSDAVRSSLRHGRPPLVLCMADVLDLPDSLPPDLPELVGDQANILVLGNKVDLLPGDSPGYLKRLQKRLLEACARVGLSQHRGGPNQRVVDVHLLSAKTGYGVEELISKMQRSWKFNGDVYLVGATNTGKSTLFNTLLQSDYCKSRASDVISRATISPWPGTTLNLLKFPIINPTPYRIFRREERLTADAAKTEEDLTEDEQNHLKALKKQSYLIGRVGRTFNLLQKLRKNYEIDFDAEALSFGSEEEPVVPSKTTKKAELSYNEVKDARWFHDTPGIIREGCVLSLLNEKEVKLVLPTYAIVPRTFILKPGMTLFLGGLGRIDYVQGDRSSWFTVVASNLLPIHVTLVEKADDIYQKHAGHKLLKVPIGGEERMKDFPPLVPQDVMLEGAGDAEAVADIKLSSAGWVAVTAHSNTKLHLRCYTLEGTALTIRKPPLLPYIVQIKGKRVRKSAVYKTKQPPPFVENLDKNVKKSGETGI
ncbi:nitric oxide-associated protein 1 [Heteronotia binoei]|uniref:nitric oxide-associated protein 1 n=1 Tax=Heteronotia binoei TaxID=13085 RepID=UPI00292DE849|nr:nitric oxide-associated protein 1 [Heteronotia binoei]